MSLVIRFFRALRTEEGWFTFIAGLGLVLCLPMVMMEIGWVDGLSTSVPIALAAYVLTVLVAKSPLPGWLATVVAAILGAEFVANEVGRILPPLVPLVGEIGPGARWLWELWRTHTPPSYIPFHELALQTWGRAELFYARVWWWGYSALTGESFVDPTSTVFLLLMGVTIWGISAYAAWGLYRRRQVLASFLPVGLGLAVNIFYSRQGHWYLLGFLTGVIFLSAREHLFVLEQRWKRTNVDYSDAIRFDVTAAGLAISAAMLGLAYLFPYVTTYKVAVVFWKYAEPPWRVMADTADRLFNEVENPAGPEEEVPQVPGGPIVGGIPMGAIGGLPRLHLLRQGEELGSRVVMYVGTSDPPPPMREEEYYLGLEEPERVTKRYWRSITYDVYNGRGWENSGDEEILLLANQAVPNESEWEARRRLEQGFELLTPYELALYAANQPFIFDQPARSRWRGNGDLIGVESTSTEITYTAVSLVPDVTTEQLENAEDNYPEWIAENYLQLPDALPSRVTELAERATAEAESPYQQALLLEDYLRNYEYTLDIPSPPGNRDVVDYFLFDLQQGYCDYYASAMVVMARSVGLPARLAVGYAMGSYDHAKRKYVVIEKDAHSWAEIYFPSYGWIEFEPTAARSVFYRPGPPPSPTGAGTTPRLPPKTLPEEEGDTDTTLDWRSVSIASGLTLWLAFLAISAWRHWRRAKMTPADYVGRFWERLIRYGMRLNIMLRANQTPVEYAQVFNGRLQGRTLDTAHWMDRMVREIRLARADINTLTEAYVRARYSPHSLTDEDKYLVARTWKQLRRRLLFIWLAPMVP
jgi:transglutaminase-like putative cysteine protease